MNLFLEKNTLIKSFDQMSASGSVYSYGGGSCVSFYSTFSNRLSFESPYRDLNKDLIRSRASLDATVSLCDSTRSSCCARGLSATVLRTENEICLMSKHLKPITQNIEGFSKELQRDPISCEKTCLAVMQNLWTIMRDFQKSKAKGEEEIAQSDFVRSTAVQHGAISGLISVMKAYKESRKIQSRALILLSVICDDNFAHQDIVAEHHGVSFILGIMTHPQHSKSSRLCLDACEALATITSLSPKSLSQLSSGEGVGALSSVMQLHYKKYDIQECALHLLNHLAKNIPRTNKRIHLRSLRRSRKSFTLLEPLEDPELIEFLIRIIAKHKRVKSVVKLGVSFIHTLAHEGSIRTKSSLVWSNAVPVLMKASKNFLSIHSLQVECFKIFLILCKERPEALDMIVDDGCGFMFDVMDAHIQNDEVLHQICQLLQLICRHQHTCAAVAKSIRTNKKYRKALKAVAESIKSDQSNMASDIMSKCLS